VPTKILLLEAAKAIEQRAVQPVAGKARRSDPSLMDVVMQGLAVAGWELVKPHRLRDRTGRLFELEAASPAKLQHIYRLQAREHLAQGAALQRAEQVQLGPSYRELGVDVGAARRVLASKGKHALEPREKLALRAAFAGGLCTLEDLRSRGILANSSCPWCGRCDTVAHRIFEECGPDHVKSLRKQLALAKWYDEGGGREDRKQLFPLHFPEAKPVKEGLCQDMALKLNGLPIDWEDLGSAKPFKKSGGPVFLDGSCLDGNTGYARAAGAMVQMGPDEKPAVVLTLAVPDEWEQTAAAGEHLTAAVFDQAAEPGATAVTDCLSVLRSAEGGLKRAEAERRPWAAVWRHMSWSWEAFWKVKAHLTRSEAKQRGEERLWAGNAAADDAAKRRAASLGPSELRKKVEEHQEEARRKYLAGAAKVLGAYPPLREFGPRQHDGNTMEALATLEVINGHELVWVAGRQRCVCLSCGASCGLPRKAELTASACPKKTALAAELLEQARARSHTPAVGFLLDGSRCPVAVCTKCGCMAEAQARGLLERCAGTARASKGNRYRLARFLQGRHPRRDEVIDGPWQGLPVAVLLADGALPVQCAPCEPAGSPSDGWASCFPVSLEGEPAAVDLEPWPEGPPDWGMAWEP